MNKGKMSELENRCEQLVNNGTVRQALEKSIMSAKEVERIMDAIKGVKGFIGSVRS